MRPRLLFCLLVLTALPSPSQTTAQLPADLTQMSLEELANIQVTSVSKKKQKLSHSAAAVYLITDEDLRRSGVTSIPEALRMVPGVQVARIDANKWAISARGFNGRYANKLLVLVDGRSVYTHLFSGVYWITQDTLLEDIARIEVIRGPGATMWGANAVNGVINIITKRAEDTQGSLVTAGGGNQDRGFGALGYGGRLGSRVHYRVFTKYFDRSQLGGAGGVSHDDWDAMRGGLRLDWKLSQTDSLTMHAGAYHIQSSSQVLSASLLPPFRRARSDDTDWTGADLLSRWTRRLGDNSDVALQFSYEGSSQRSPTYGERRDTFDLDFQHRLALGASHEVLWGLGYRFAADRTDGSFSFSLNPSRRGDHLVSAFLQDDLTLAADRLRLTVGSKIERNDYTGWELQPNVRLLWTPERHHAAWAAVSRAVRTPSRSDHDLRVNAAVFPGPQNQPSVIAILGNPHLGSEVVRAHEAGYRFQPTSRVSLDVAAFYNRYANLRTVEPGAPFLELTPSPAHLVIPSRFENKMRGETYGVEVATKLQVHQRWRLSPGYSRLNMLLHRHADSRDANAEADEGESPAHQGFLQSYLDLPGRLQLDTSLYYVAALPALGIASYTRLDVRLGWRPAAPLEFSLGLQNLLDKRHPEFFQTAGGSSGVVGIGRGVYGKVTWRF